MSEERTVAFLLLERERLRRYRDRISLPTSGSISRLLGLPDEGLEADWISTRLRTVLLAEIDRLIHATTAEIARLTGETPRQ